MSGKANRIEEVIFTVGQLTSVVGAPNTGSYFDSYSPYPINGTIHSITVGSNSYNPIGSLLFYVSGTQNIVNDGLILRIRAGSQTQTFYPFVTMVDNQSVAWNAAGSVQTAQWVVNGPIRVVGSGIGSGTSGTFVSVKYM